MRSLNGVLPIVVSVGLISAVTAILWRLNSTAAGSYHLVYVYLFAVALIAALYNGRLALLGTALALICADYFLQKPLYILGNDNPLEYGDLFVFALLAITAIKVVQVLTRGRASAAWRPSVPTQRGSFSAIFLISSLLIASNRRLNRQPFGDDLRRASAGCTASPHNANACI